MPTGSKSNEPKEVSSALVLGLALRPRTLSGLYGQEATVKAIRAHMEKRPPHTWLFTGPPGSGKTTLARIISVSLQCEHMKLWGDPCPDCWKARSSFSIHEINASKVSGVEELEKVAELSMSRPMSGQKRVIVLDEVQNISKTAWSMMLNPMEHPPDFTVWILCTSEASKVPAANQRRCVKYQLKTLGISEAEAFLKKQATRAGIDLPLEPLFEALHTMSVSAPGLLLQALEKYAAGSTASEAVAGSDGAGVDAFKMCREVTSGNWEGVKKYLATATPEDARWMRASLSGWLKGCLMREKSPSRCETASMSIIELSTPPWDDTMLLNWLHGLLYRITRRYGR